MKKNILLYILPLTLLAFNSYGQGLEFQDRELNKMVLAVNLDGPGMVTKEMSQELRLTTEQYKTVENVNKQRFQQLIEAEETLAGEPELLRRTFESINLTIDRSLSAVLSQEQLNHYLELTGRKELLQLYSNQQD